MNNKEIVALLTSYNLNSVEFNILRDCSQAIDESELEKNTRYLALKKRLYLVDHMLAILPEDETIVLKLHLIEQKSWNTIARLQDDGGIPEIVALDRRSLQRTQSRALKKVFLFIRKMFGTSLDYLTIDSNG